LKVCNVCLVCVFGSGHVIMVTRTVVHGARLPIATSDAGCRASMPVSSHFMSS